MQGRTDSKLVVRDTLNVADAIFTSASSSPAPGDWLGILVYGSAVGTQFNRTILEYAGGTALDLRGAAPVVNGITVKNTGGTGIRVTDGASPLLSGIYVTANNIGVEAAGGAKPDLQNSFIAGNVLGVSNSDIPSLVTATGNWWGHPTGPLDSSNDVGGLFNPTGLGNPVTDGIDYSPWTPVIPLLGTSLSIAEGSSTESIDITLNLACSTCSEYRASETPDFTGVAFQPFASAVPFQLSANDALKTVHVQFRTSTGNSGGDSSASIRLDTAGPSLAVTSPAADAIITRPVTITATASDPAGVAKVEFIIDGQLAAIDTTNAYSHLWDTSAVADGGHELKIIAYDTVGHTTTDIRTLTLSKAPPAAPAITAPTAGNLATRNVDVSGTAEAGISVSLFNNGLFLRQVVAGPSGTFQCSGVTLLEGNNSLTATASDSGGASPQSAAVLLTVDTGPPAAPNIYSSTAVAGGGVKLGWTPDMRELPASYRLYRSSTEFSAPDAALLVNGNITTTSFTDLPPIDGQYFYAVTAMDSVGNESPLSPRVTVTADRTPPTAAVEFTPAGPVGPGTVAVRLLLSEPLAAPPYLGISTGGDAPAVVNLSSVTDTEWTGTYQVTALTPDGAAAILFAGKDLTGNKGTVITSGASLLIDTRGPSATLMFSPSAGPYKPGALNISLTLDEPATQAPTLRFTPPTGAQVPITVAGSGKNWTGVLTVTAGMGDGSGSFTMAAVDAFGNTGSTITAGGTITLDITPPAAPAGLTATAIAKGEISLAWGTVADSAGYSVYRSASGSTITLPATPVAAGLTSASFIDLPPTDGGYRYAVTAVDQAGNESTLSADVVTLSDRQPPGAPTALTTSLSGNVINLNWTPPAGEAAANYNLYRSTTAITTTTGLTPVKKGISTASGNDSPTEDATYHYVVTAVDTAGNEGLPSNDTSILYNLSPPSIAVSGVTDGEYSPGTVTPVITIKSASLVSQTIQLDGQPFASGTPVTSEGQHLLRIEATDGQSRKTTRDLSFTIDLTDPVITISNVAEGILYETSIAPVIEAADTNLDTIAITMNGSTYVSGTPLVSDGAKTLRVEARDLAGRTKVVTVNFTVDTAPPLPESLTLTATQGGGTVLEWTASAAADLAGYHVYRNGTRLTQTPLSVLTYSDAAPDGTVLQEYHLTTMDTKGHESGPLVASVPPVKVVLKDYGRPLNAGFMLNKQFIENINVDIVNSHTSPVTIGAFSYELLDQLGKVGEGTETGPINLAAGAIVSRQKILPIGNGIVDYRTYNVRLTLPSDTNVTVRKIAAFSLDTFDPGRKVEIFNDPLVKGVKAKISLKIFNHGSVPIELLTATGDQPSAEIYVLLKDKDGNTLAKGNLLQKGAGVINYGGGYTLAGVAPGGSFLTAPIDLLVPANAPDTVYLQAYVTRIYYHYKQPDQIVAGDFSGYISAQISNPSYFATVTPDKPAYDQDTPVMLSGRAYDAGSSLPVPDVDVKIGIGVKGFARYLQVRTDSAGNYTTFFTPLPGEAGDYTLWATHPSVADKPVQSGFTIFGLGFDPRLINLRMSKNSSFSMPVSIKNLGESDLTGIQLAVAGGSGITGSVDVSDTATSIEGGKSTSFKLTLNADMNAPDATSATVTVTTSEGITRTLEINISLLAALPAITTDPGFIETAVSRGSSKAVTFRLKNTGYAPLQNIVIQPPELPWIGLLSGNTLPDLDPGQSVDIGVNFRPTDSVAQGSHTDKLVITSANHVPYTLNLFPVVSSTSKGSVHFQVTDSLNKQVSGAAVTLQHQKLGGITLTGKTDVNGELSFLDITEGMYNYQVKAAGHDNVVSTVEILPEVVSPVAVFMNNVFVTFDWTVTPMTITDKYSIKLEATFETNVPAPVITIDPAYEKLEIEIGSTYVGEYRVKNHGLVALDNVKIAMAGGPGLRVDVLVSELPRINAQETVIIPYRITVNPFKSPEPVDPCSDIPIEVNVGGSYVCAAGVPSWTGVTGTKSIKPKDRYDPFGLCEVGCDWCKCAPAAAQSICNCIKTLDPCTCLGVGAGDGAATVCGCVTGSENPVGCLATAAGDAATEAVKDKILSYVPIIGQLKDALDTAKNIASCILCLLEALPPLPTGTVAAPSGGGGGFGGFGGGGGGNGFSTVRVCR